jgi:hypothetical protein
VLRRDKDLIFFQQKQDAAGIELSILAFAMSLIQTSLETYILGVDINGGMTDYEATDNRIWT